MTLNRLMIITGILVLLAGGGSAWLWEYAYSPQGRARVIIAQLRGNDTTLRGWMLKHQLVRPGFPTPHRDKCDFPLEGLVFAWACEDAAADEMVKLGREALPIVIETLRDEDLFVVEMAIKACGKFRDPAAIQPLAKCMRSGFMYEFSCRDALIEIGPEAYGQILEAFKECPRRVRPTIPGALAAKWGVAAVPPLMELLEDSSESIRADAAAELGKLKDKRATDALIRHLSDQYISAKVKAAEALGEIGDHKAIPAILKTVKDAHIDNFVRIPAAVALARMGQDEGLQFLLSMLKSRSPEERANAIGSLGTNQIKGTIEPLLSLLGDSDMSVRLRAAMVLGKRHDPRAIPALRQFLNDSNLYVRRDVTETLEKLGVKLPPASQPASAVAG
jgi:HEAT repeat protein